MIKTISTINLLLLAFTTLGSYACAQDADEKETTDPEVEMLTLKLLVVDPDDHPIEGATVKPRGLRTKIERASWYSWRGKKPSDPVPEVLTDETGIAEVPYPKYVFEKAETGTVNLNVTHPDFVMFDDDRFVDANQAKVKLKRGFRIAVTAIDAQTGESIKTDLYAATSVQGSGQWQQKKSGMLVSPTLEKKICVLRIMQFVDGQPTKFSKRIEIKPGERSRILQKDVKLSLGVRVEGKLEDAVPRPIKNGHISACCNHNADPDGRGWNRWSWSDRAEIKEDGTFVFESLPDDEVLQLIPVCDDWVPGKAKREDVMKHFPNEARQLGNDWAALPQLAKTDGNQSEVVLPMLRAKDIKVTLLDPEGNTLPNTAVLCAPNQYWFDGGSQLLGEAYCSRDFIKDPESVKRLWVSSNRYGTKTDVTGTAFIRNLPDTKLARSLSVQHDDYELPIDGNRRKATFEFAETGVTEVTLKLQKKGTEVLDGSQAQKQQNDLNAARNAIAWVKDFVEGWLK